MFLSPLQRFGILVCLLMSTLSRADDDGRDVARDIGAVLAWRLGPQLVEHRCEGVDPEGADSRRKALQRWIDKNGKLIQAVDDRIAEVAPLILPKLAKNDAVRALEKQIEKIFEESIFSGLAPEELVAVCKAEANPKSKRWNNTGMPQIQESLAALYDWKIQQGGKTP